MRRQLLHHVHLGCLALAIRESPRCGEPAETKGTASRDDLAVKTGHLFVAQAEELQERNRCVPEAGGVDSEGFGIVLEGVSPVVLDEFVNAGRAVQLRALGARGS